MFEGGESVPTIVVDISTMGACLARLTLKGGALTKKHFLSLKALKQAKAGRLAAKPLLVVA